MTENQLRDLLIKNLSVINPNYTYLSKETYLPHDIGTRSFIDILAYNTNGKYVVIELKKSNTSAREALHELHKYLEAVKSNLSVRSDEIELVIVSTEWKELLIPYSSFIANTNLNSYGYQLFINDDKLSAKKIHIYKEEHERVLSSIQMARYYSDDLSLKKGICEHIDFFKNRGIENFILILLEAPENYNEMTLKYIQSTELQFYGEIKTENLDQQIDYKYLIYSVNQILSIEKITNILNKYYNTTNTKESIEDIIESNDTNYDKMEALNELLINQEPFPKSEFTELGYPAKYLKLINQEKWKVLEIKKYGGLDDNILLTNDVIESEITSSGTSKELYISNIDLTNNSNIKRVKKDIKNCLSDNIIWRNHILEILDYLIDKESSSKSIKCTIYNPMNIIYSIYLTLNTPEGIEYLPRYEIEVTKNDETNTYTGYLEYNFTQTRTMNEILTKYWNSAPLKYLLTLSHGGYFDKNLELCNFIGIEYKTMLIKETTECKIFYSYENYKFSKVEAFNPIENFLFKLLSENSLSTEILSFFDKHQVNNGIFIFDPLKE